MVFTSIMSFGANNIKRLKSSVANSLYLGLLISSTIAISGSLCLNPIMRFLEVPENLYSDAYKYIIIVIATIPIAMAYNVLANFLRAIGEALAPLVILIISAITNVILDLLFVFVFNFGIVGAAVATAIAQLISAIACWIYIIKNQQKKYPCRIQSGRDIYYLLATSH